VTALCCLVLADGVEGLARLLPAGARTKRFGGSGQFAIAQCQTDGCASVGKLEAAYARMRVLNPARFASRRISPKMSCKSRSRSIQGKREEGIAQLALAPGFGSINTVKPRRTMRQKTYLNPAEQWDRSVAVVQAAPRNLVYRKELGDGLFIGRVVASHRLFCAGDVVFVYISNGMAERQPVWAVSSKGYRIKNFYMQYHRCRELFDAGPLRFVELPGHLAGRKPDDPDVRQFVVGTLRAGDSAAR
jgi:hypothetical protein